MTWGHQETQPDRDIDTSAPRKAWMDHQPNYKLLSAAKLWLRPLKLH